MDRIHRKRLRLTEYDYSLNGAYFITICVDRKKNILWEDNLPYPVNAMDAIPLSTIGKIVEQSIRNISKVYPYCVVDKYAIMPDHIHLILEIDSDADKVVTVSHIVSQFKGYITKSVKSPIWQKSFYDHIIRNDVEYDAIWRYIDNNPFALGENEENNY